MTPYLRYFVRLAGFVRGPQQTHSGRCQQWEVTQPETATRSRRRSGRCSEPPVHRKARVGSATVKVGVMAGDSWSKSKVERTSHGKAVFIANGKTQSRQIQTVLHRTKSCGLCRVSMGIKVFLLLSKSVADTAAGFVWRRWNRRHGNMAMTENKQRRVAVHVRHGLRMRTQYLCSV